jgi:hypothetical protein
MGDRRYLAFAAAEQAPLRLGLEAIMYLAGTAVFAAFIASAKDYFALKNTCCTKKKTPFGSFLSRGILFTFFSVVMLYVACCFVFVDPNSLRSVIVGSVVAGFSFFTLCFSVGSLRLRLTTERHKVIAEEFKRQNRHEIQTADELEEINHLATILE